MGTKTNVKDLLSRGVSKIIPDKNSFEKLISKKKIRLYLGIDPTGGKLHLGHTINLLKLQEFADLGHEAILVIGTGTVIVGDPSQREEARKKITKSQIQKNIKTWKKQAGKILDFKKVKIKYNGDWILKLKYEDIVSIASNITAPHLFQRDNFQKRIKKGDTVWYHETMYPLMQGYDSVYLDVDLEIGGTDQLFNMLVGRELQKKMRNREKYVMACNMIMGVDGQQMSKTSGNCIWLEDSGREMFGKIMSMPDDSVFDYFELITRVPVEEIEKMKNSRVNPRDLKARLGREIVKMYHSEKEAEAAEKEFEKVFKNKEMPDSMPEMKISEKELSILDLLVKAKLVSSKAEARRLVEQGGVKINQEVKKDWKEKIKISSGMIVRAGKRKFVKIV
jgi:tyrosyl-tRNA synthetase